MDEISHWYLHVDLDAFFASVEQLDHPEYKGKPVIVGGKPEDRRSVVSTASYEARKFGVHSAMPTYQAYKLCPQGIFVHGRMQRYSEISYQIMSIFKDFSPDVQQMSIDEAFIDLTGTEKLFGPPEETALKIKKIVKEQTGLTVSVGLATTKYLAKIASGFSKPDGFHYIHQGDEEKFMLALPLNKVWGLGEKSLQLLKSKGICTTRDIYEKDLDTLTFLFGANMGNFLYEVVHGREKNSFQRETKNHSISSETTFPYDLTDIYTIETELLELAQGVFFRLLKDNAYSRTAFIKIRYGDFSTFSVQETLDRNILTIDSYFEILKRLFEKKYDNTRGIRLLGVGLDNIENTEKPYQQELFESNESKKQIVEKAILNMEKKHPEIKVRKARTLKGGSLKTILFLALLFLCPVKAEAQETDDITEKTETSDSLFQYEINDEEKVSYTISGFWQSQIINSASINFGDEKLPLYSLNPPVFKQEVELSTYILLDNHWFFRADFADEFKKNTIAMGYQGDQFLRSATLANRGITMPSGYSAEAFGYDLQGGENQAPGLNAHFQSQNNKFESDLLLRYDMTKTKSATFYGKNQVNDNTISHSNILYGFAYKFPETAENLLYEIDSIYVENKNGRYLDQHKRKYNKLSASDYYFSKINHRLYLSESSNAGKQDDYIPEVIITFRSKSAVKELMNATGTYDNASTFAGKIQKEFGSEYSLSDYSVNPETIIENKSGIVLQSNYGFSPYVDLSYYDCGINEYNDIQIVDAFTETLLSDYTAIKANLLISQYADFFQPKHFYVSIVNEKLADSFYPFADSTPEIYLNLKSEYQINILSRTFTQISDFNIGTEACSGTVLVYKNNVVDTGAIYDKNSGTVTLSAHPASTDKIYIIWQEESSDYMNGAVAGAAGFKYHFTPNLTTDLALTIRWPVSIKSQYATQDTVQKGFAALSTGIIYSNENLTLSDKIAFAVQKENTTSGLMVASQKNYTSSFYYLDPDSGYNTKIVPEIKTKNGNITLKNSANSVTGNHKGVKDSEIKGYAIPLSYDFSNQKDWASMDIHLEARYLLQNSSDLIITLKSDTKLKADDADVYLQLGIKAEEDSYGENPSSITSFKLKNLDLSKKEWQKIKIPLDNTVRSKLHPFSDVRLIIVNKSQLTSNTKGTLYFGPYEPVIKGLETNQSEGILVTTGGIKVSDDSYTSVINWHIPATTDIDNLENTSISTDIYFKQTSFNFYENIELTFTVNGFNKKEFTTADKTSGFILALADSSLQNTSNKAMEIKIEDITDYMSEFPVNHKLSINLADKKAFIDNKELPEDLYSLKINSNINPSKMMITVNTVQGSHIYNSGHIYIHDLIFTISKLYTSLHNKAELQYQNKEELLYFGDYAIIRDLAAGISSSQNWNFQEEISGSSTTLLHSGITVADIKLQADTLFNDTQLYNAGHNISTDKSLFRFLDFSEEYRFNPSEINLTKSNTLGFDLSDFSIPWKTSFSAQASDEIYFRNQSIAGSSSLNFPFGLTVNIQAKASQNNTKSKQLFNEYDYNTYYTAWKDISVFSLSAGEDTASIRNESFDAALQLQFPIFSPELDYGIIGNYSKNTTPQLEDLTCISLNLPIEFNEQTLALKLSRSGGNITELTAGGSYSSDAQKVLNLQKERLWIYKSVPFYELWDANLSDTVTGTYSPQYELSYNRKLFNDMKDLYIPSDASFIVQRSITSDSEKSNLYQYKASITNTSLNNFGALSKNRIFNWFQQEEIVTNLSGIVKVPEDLPENTTYQLSAYLQLLLYIDSSRTISSVSDYSIETGSNWNTHSTFIYSRNGKNSLVCDLINLISPKEIDFEITRKETLSVEIGRTSGLLHQNYSYSHGADFKFLKNFTIQTILGTSFSHSEENYSSLGIELTLGGKAEF